MYKNNNNFTVSLEFVALECETINVLGSIHFHYSYISVLLEINENERKLMIMYEMKVSSLLFLRNNCIF